MPVDHDADLAVKVFGGSGLLILLVGAAHLRSVAVARRTASQLDTVAGGRVVDYRSVVVSGGEESPKWTRYDPVVEFADAGDVLQSVVIRGSESKWSPVGKRVEVVYDPRCPARARIAGFNPDFNTFRCGPVIVLLIGLGFLLSSAGYWLSQAFGGGESRASAAGLPAKVAALEVERWLHGLFTGPAARGVRDSTTGRNSARRF